MAQLALTLFGTYELTRDGQPVAGAIPIKGRALLAYLAVEAPRPHAREVLAEMLWPDHGPQVARDSLRDTLARLRLALGERTAAVPLLLITRDTVRFSAAGDSTLDVAVFAALLATCASHPHPRIDRCGPCMRRMTQAAALYRGDFLQQFTVGDSAAFEEWAALHRERLRRQALETFAHLAAYHEHRGDYAHASEYAERQVVLDPWQEEAHRQVMRALAFSGQRGAALDHYQRCRRILEDDLGAELAEETTRLAAHIRTGTLSQPPPPAARHAQLPVQLTSFIGREAERAALARRLEDPACRLLTLTGPGGVGKTRLALRVATDIQDDFADGVAFVSLASLRDPGLVASTIVQALGITETGGQALESLTAYLRPKQMLLLLDTFEQVRGAAPLVADLLTAGPTLVLLVTSRAPLGVYGEQTLEVGPMALPNPLQSPSPEDLNDVEAIRLFSDRARAASMDFTVTAETLPLVATICRRLDGLPLAIELAAARIRHLPLALLLARLEPRLPLLMHGPLTLPQRQRTMRATLDWSYDLLDPWEQALFRRLGVFVGSWSLTAAAQVVGMRDRGWGEEKATIPTSPAPNLQSLVPVEDGLQVLCDENLLRQAQPVGGELRWTMLETIREYALERLQLSEEADAIQRRHAAYYVACAEEVARNMNGADQERWLGRLAIDLDNIRSALQWLLERGAAEEAQRLCAAIWLFMRGRANHREGRHLLQAALALPKVPVGLRVQVLIGAGWLAIEQGDSEQGSSYFEEILAVADELEDQRVVADACRGLGRVAMEHRQATAEQYFQRSLSLTRAVGDEVGEGWSLSLLGVLALNRGDAREAMARQAAALARFRALQHLVGMAACLSDLGAATLAAGDRASAIAATREGIVVAQHLGSHEIVVRHLMNMALIVASQAGELTTNSAHVERAARLWGAIEGVRERNDLPVGFRGRDAPSIARTCAQVDRETWAAAWAEGRAMTLEQAIAYALEATGPQ